MMTEIERLRFYLRDPDGETTFFKDAELHELLEFTSSFEEAVGMGWFVKASGAATQSSTASTVSRKTIGKISTEYGGASMTDSVNTAFAMAKYWLSKSGVSSARFFSIVPEGGFIGESVAIINAIEAEQFSSLDHSRLLSLFW